MNIKVAKLGYSALALLDDATAVTPDPNLWYMLVRSWLKQPLNTSQNLVAKKTKPNGLINHFTNAPTFVSNRPSLKQMMNDYNKRSSSQPLIRSNQNENTNFAIERVHHIKIPQIPGKILRPTLVPTKK